ncbi:MAG: hypothetical protein Q4G33_03055 [bacterium]|nr:hypothetical protein [bacterium]
MYNENYELLANAIVVQAAKDYMRAKSQIVRNEVKNFFLSDWFSILTNMDGRRILKKLEKERQKKRHREVS